MAAGKIKLQANDGKVLSLVAPDGMVEDTTKSLLDFTNTSIPLSKQLKGTYSLSNTVKTLAFDAITYTGKATSQEIVTGLSTIDFTQASNGTGFYHDRVAGDCIVKNDAGDIVESGEIAFKHFAGVDGVCKVHIKRRDQSDSNYVFDGLRGTGKLVFTDSTSSELYNETAWLTDYTDNGFNIGSSSGVNANLSTYISYITLYTHIKWGLTSQGKRYIEAYNPVTNDTMIMYQGSGIAGHEIPHSVGVKLDFVNIKNLDITSNWSSHRLPNRLLTLNTTDLESDETVRVTAMDSTTTTMGTGSYVNGDANSHILYGKAKSKTWTIVPYTGTGVAGNFVETKDVDGIARRARRVTIKSVNYANSWLVFDTARPLDNYAIYLHLSNAEYTGINYIDISDSGITFPTADNNVNASGWQYIALVEFDTDGTGTSGSYFDNPTNTTNLQLDDGLISISRGYNVTGADNKVVSNSGTIVPINNWIS